MHLLFTIDYTQNYPAQSEEKYYWKKIDFHLKMIGKWFNAVINQQVFYCICSTKANTH